MTDDLIAFLRAQLDAEEAALIARRDGHPGECLNYEGQDPDGYDGYDSCYLHLRAAEATPYRDVEFGLAEVDAKRRILDWLVDCASKALDGNWWNLEVEDAFKAMAQPYASYPDFRDEWRIP
jgi:hypothetical protein